MNNNNEINNILITMREIIEMLPQVGDNKEELINSFVDGFVIINEQIQSKEQYNDNIQKTEKLEEALVSIVSYYNENEISKGNIIIEKELAPLFLSWESIVKYCLVHKVILCGINLYSSAFHELLDTSVFEVIAFLNLPEVNKEAETIHGTPVLGIEDLNHVVYDFIVIVTEKHEDIEKLLVTVVEPKKIINYMKQTMEYANIYNKLYENNYEFNFVHSNLEKAMNDKSNEVIITGMSYSLHGVNTELLWRKGVKLCWASQDIYYDYLLTKKAVDRNENIKYCIIGMAYFSFDIDLSQLKTQTYLIDRIYYPLLEDSHHYTPSETYASPVGISQIERFLMIQNEFSDMELLKSFASAASLLMSSELHDSIWNRPCENLPLEWLGQKRSRLHSKHSYPETRLENMQILRSMLTMLSEKGIKPIIVVFPTSGSYAPYLNPELKSRFYQLINELQEVYNFSVYDYFESELFNQFDFADTDHLNKKGAAKMTSILNTILEHTD